MLDRLVGAVGGGPGEGPPPRRGGTTMDMTREDSASIIAPRSRIAIDTSTARVGLGLAGAGWAALAVMWGTGSAHVFGHDQHGVPVAVGTGLFLIGWVVMSAAMMLPSSVPTLRALDRGAIGGTPRAANLMLGYFSAWAVFGLAAYAGDAVLHRSVH